MRVQAAVAVGSGGNKSKSKCRIVKSWSWALGRTSRCHWHQCSSIGPSPNRVNTRNLELDHPVTVQPRQTFTLNSARLEHEKLSHTQSSMLHPQHLLKSCLKFTSRRWNKEGDGGRKKIFPNGGALCVFFLTFRLIGCCVYLCRVDVNYVYAWNLGCQVCIWFPFKRKATSWHLVCPLASWNVKKLILSA